MAAYRTTREQKFVLFLLLALALVSAIGLGIGLAANRNPEPRTETAESLHQTSSKPPGGLPSSKATQSSSDKDSSTASQRCPTEQPTSATDSNGSKQGHYRFAGVATSVDVCSQIGTEIMARQCGSAVDAAIAAVFCIGVGNAQSSGIGGGNFITIYHRENQSAVTITSREKAPEMAAEDMFLHNNASSTTGGLAIGVPGEVMGLFEAHRRFGRLPWKDLLAPTIQLCRDGVPVLGSLASAIRSTESRGFLEDFPNLREILTNPATGQIYKNGEKMKRPKLAETLQRIADEGPATFYSGTLAKNISDDIQEAGGIVTLDDLRNYTVNVDEALTYELEEGVRIFSPQLPSSGVVLSYILNILDDYNFTEASVSTPDETILTYHRIIEAFKFAYAKRTDLGDPDFLDGIDELVRNMTSRDFGRSIREMISDDFTHNVSYYGPTFYDNSKPGTAHISVLGPNGDAVSITTTVNLHFGSKVVGSRTGIVFNDEMDDFSTPNTTNAFGVPASPANFIHPGKRPLSSMSPSVVVDKSGDVILVVGAAGGTMITTTVAEVIMRNLWFKQDPKSAIDTPRFHHQLLPDYVRYDTGLTQDIVQGLEAKGHKMENIGVESNCNAISQSQNGILACSDRRKGGSAPDGY